MALEDKKGQMGSSRVPDAPKEKAPIPEPKKETDSSLWKGSQYLKGESLRGWAKSDEAWRKTNLSETERTKISQDLFGKEGDYFKKKDADKTLKILTEKKAYAKTDSERQIIDKEIKVVKSILGK